MKVLCFVVLLQALLVLVWADSDTSNNGRGPPAKDDRGRAPGTGDKRRKDPVKPDFHPEEGHETAEAAQKRAESAPGRRVASVLNGRSERAMVADLTRGWAWVLPSDTDQAKWLVKPTSTFTRCKMQGVMRLRWPSWARSLSLHLAFSRPRRYSFHVGDSPRNNAWGGDDSWRNKWDAEIHTYYSGLYAYRNEHGGNTQLFGVGAVHTALMIRISRRREGIYYINYDGGVSHGYHTHEMFRMTTNNYIYLGLNRVIRNHRGSPSPSTYIGSGLCSVAAYWT